jgi:hypothetical protein
MEFSRSELKTTAQRIGTASQPSLKKPFRLLIRSVCGSANLATSTCERRLGRDGQLAEIIHLDGDGDDITDEQLEKWIASFPIESLP